MSLKVLSTALVGYEFQSSYRCYQCKKEKYTPEIGWFLKEDDPYQHSTCRTYPGPNCISCAYGQCLGRLNEQEHADSEAYQETEIPEPGCCARFIPGPAEAIRETDLEKTSNYENDPIHDMII
jgi:hypothetical protein